MAEYTRMGRQEFPSTDPERRGRIDVAYVYMDEQFQTVMVKVPIEEDTEARIKDELAKAAERAAGAGPPKVVI